MGKFEVPKVVKITEHMLLDFENLGIGLIVKIHRCSEATLGPDKPHNRWAGVFFNTYDVDVLIDDHIEHLRIEVAHEQGAGTQRMDWATSRLAPPKAFGGSVHFLQVPA
jgi:hypothetical protein